MKRQVIRLTEGDLHHMINETVNRILTEEMDEGLGSWLGGMAGKATNWVQQQGKDMKNSWNQQRSTMQQTPQNTTNATNTNNTGDNENPQQKQNDLTALQSIQNSLLQIRKQFDVIKRNNPEGTRQLSAAYGTLSKYVNAAVNYYMGEAQKQQAQPQVTSNGTQPQATSNGTQPQATSNGTQPQVTGNGAQPQA